MSLFMYDVLGTLGVAMIVGAYLGLQLGKLFPQGLRYSTLNAVGAALILVSLIHNFNWPAFLVESFWLAISVFGIAQALSKKRRAAG